MSRKRAPEDIVNAVFAKPDPLLLSDSEIEKATGNYKRGVAQTGRKRNFTPEGLANLMLALRRPKSEEHKAKLRKPKSEDTKAKLRAIWKTKVITEEDRAKFRAARAKQVMPPRDPILVARLAALHKGRKRSEESKQRMREAHKRRVWPMKTCPHCGLTARAVPNFFRYHFDNCKRRP